MKYLLIIFDGMADEPLAELDGKTPMQVAKTPNMDRLASKGVIGAANTTPEGMSTSSDVTNMGILGFDPIKYYKGRGAIEAASLGIPMETRDAAFRMNLVSTDGEIMIDSSADHISNREAHELVETIDRKLSSNLIKFYPGVSYRNIMIWRGGSDNVSCMAPYKIHGKPIKDYYPNGDGDSKLRSLIEDSYEILDNHPVNRKRRDEGHLAANMIWFWGESRLPEIPSFLSLTGMSGSVIAGVDLIKGLGRMVGLSVADVPGATGYVDTNFAGKAQYALTELEKHDFVWVHVEAPDEAGHESDIEKKIKAIEDCDTLVLGNILGGIEARNYDFRLLLMPDHPTPIATGAHSPDRVPFLLFDSTKQQPNTLPMDERGALDTKLIVDYTPDLLKMLLDS
ncbi:MAG: cofactor-independent phosphoglycerate mutase [Armatimonadetes bacterium]|nr:cofactor-independent phosphoglycerate mutase [Armatimonadota bacterium]